MDNHHHHHRFDMNPLLIGLVGVLAGGIVVAICHCLVVLCGETQSEMLNHDTNVTSTANTMPQNRTIQVIIQSKEYNQDVCSICLGEFKQEERVSVLPECAHIFHVTCISKWLLHHSNCPLCRASALQPPPPLTVNSAAESDRASGSGENVEC